MRSTKNHLDLVAVGICNLNIITGQKEFCRLCRSVVLKHRRRALLLHSLSFLFASSVGMAQPTTLLTNAVDVISLSAEQASSSLKVLVTGIVTAADPALKGRFFVQDATGGVFVDNANGRRFEAGDVVEVSGITYEGAFAPTITAPTVRKVGVSALPPAKQVSVEELMSGAEDSQRIEISGIVRDVRKDGNRLTLDLVTGGYRFRAFVLVATNFQPETLVGAQVRMRGTAAEAHNRSLRQLIAVEVYIPNFEDLRVEKPESMDPFERSIVPLDKLAQFRRNNSLAQRVHVRGVVTFQRVGECVFVQDRIFGLQIQSRQTNNLAIGAVIEAIGFLSFENNLPVLQDAIIRKSFEPPMPIKPRPATVDELQNGLFHADYISLAGNLVERTTKQTRHRESLMETTTLVLQTTNFTFTAIADRPAGKTEQAVIPIGSILNVSGICLTEIDSDGKLKSVQIIVGNPEDIRVIKKPSWLTPQRLLVGFTIACVVLMVIVSWTVVLSRKNSILNFLIQEREKAQAALQNANDELEERVKERTAQLKLQITARKEAEVQFKAVLTERTRLAQELHDTVEQTLTGIVFQLDSATKLSERDPKASQHHLELARNLMDKSQDEMRQSVWDLRRRALEQFDLSKALAEGARQITAGTGVQAHVETKGQIRPLPEVVEDNLLRIGQEALSNVVKHSHATTANIELKFSARLVVLRIEDTGEGFNPDQVNGPQEGHFGLLGMSERAKRLCGRFTVESVLGKGTVICVEIPLDHAHQIQPSEAVNS